MTTILSWNVNGLRAVLKNGFMEWFEAAQPDILCVQESRALPEDLDESILRPAGYTTYFNPAKKKGYSGTATFVRDGIKLLSTTTTGIDHIDDEGRVQVMEFEQFTILNGYWPNSQAKRFRLPYKLDFVTAVTFFAKGLVEQGRNVVLCGDFNIAHQPIDLARPKGNENNAGYYAEERAAMDNFLEAGFVDTFRHYHPGEPNHYSWWSFRAGARAKNVGWRIDYHCVNKDFMRRVSRAWISCDVMGSDHCPVGIEVKD